MKIIVEIFKNFFNLCCLFYYSYLILVVNLYHVNAIIYVASKLDIFDKDKKKLYKAYHTIYQSVTSLLSSALGILSSPYTKYPL